MKTPLLITTFVLFFNLQAHANNFGINLPFGSQEKIIKVRELPRVSTFQLKDGTYYDVGSMYTKKQLLWLGYSFGEPEYVGYINSQDMYVPLNQADINNIIGIAHMQLPEHAQISFFDKYLSRLILILILSAMGYYFYQLYQKRKARLEAENADEIHSWPPTAAH